MYGVRKRFGNEILDVREFIRPDTYMVAQLASSRQWSRPEDAWAWVLQHVKYPWGPFDRHDRHVLLAYLEEQSCAFLEPQRCRAALVYEADDYWELPSEVLRDRIADCDGATFLLVSLLRRLWPALPAYATVGYFEEYGHVWGTVYRDGSWYVMETTLEALPPQVPLERSPYRPLFRFNEREVLVHRWQVPARVRDSAKVERVRTAYKYWAYGGR